LLAPINIISEEEIIRVGREAAILEKSEKVIILPMNVA
jgi:hypothetical protein